MGSDNSGSVTRAPTRFVAQLQALESPFSARDVEGLFPKLRPSSVSVYLSHAVKSGLIAQVGVKKFAHAQPSERSAQLPKFARDLMGRLRRRILPAAFSQLVVWTNESLAPFTHDAFPDPFLVIEGPRDVLATIQTTLDDDAVAWVHVRGRSDLGRQLWDRKSSRVRVFLVNSAQLDGTKPSMMGFQVPTISRLFVSVLGMPPLMPETALDVMAHPEFDLEEAIRATPSRRSAATLGAFLGWVRDTHPKHPASGRINEFMHAVHGEW